jgi:hypothetical protein
VAGRSPSLEKTGPWPQYAEDLLETLPGIVSARIAGQELAVTEIQISYEPIRPIGEIAALVRLCLETETDAKLTRTRFRALLVPPSQRASESSQVHPLTGDDHEQAGASRDSLRLVSYHTRTDHAMSPTIDVVIDFKGRTFRGSAALLSDSPHGLEAPALATLRALEECLSEFYAGSGSPSLALESAMSVQVEESDVAVVAVRAFLEGSSLPLTAASPIERGAPALAVILATIRASARTVTRWLRTENTHAATRFHLVDVAVAKSVGGGANVGVRLSAAGEAVMSRRRGEDTLDLAAEVTVDAVWELLSRGAPVVEPERALRHTGVGRIRIPGHDLAVVLVEARVKGMIVPLAGATHAGNGLERACVTAALQATNPFVAEVDWTQSAEMAQA